MFCIFKSFVQNVNDKRERKKIYMIEISNLSGINDGCVRGYFQKGAKFILVSRSWFIEQKAKLCCSFKRDKIMSSQWCDLGIDIEAQK